MIRFNGHWRTASSLALGGALAAFSTLGPALANESLSNTDIFLDIRTDNAAIDTLTSFGFDNFNQGTHVSDWGFMLDGVSATFQNNTTSGGGLPFGVLSNSGGIISGTASYTYGAYAITVTRQYQIVGAGSVLVTTTIQNTGQSIGSFLGYDTFDPDIGIPRSGPFSTYNDVFTDSGILIGLASDTVTTGYSVALGVTDSRAVVAAGNPFQINSPSSLTGVATAPFDGNGALADQGLHVVFSAPLASGAGTTFQYFLNFGTSPAGALSALSSAMTSVCPTSVAADNCLLTSASNQNLTIDAQGGSDTLQLGGAVDFSFDAGKLGTTYTNFEVFQKDGTSTVTLTGSAGLTTLGFDVLNGRLIAGAGTLGATGSNSVGAGATLEIAGNNAVGSVSGLGTFEISSGVVTANSVIVDHFVINSGSLGGGILAANTHDILGGNVTSQLRVGDSNAVNIAAGAQVTSALGTPVLWVADATAAGIQIVNDGIIHTSGVADGIGVSGTRTGAMMIANTGSITSDGGTALYFGTATGPVTMTNSGTIGGLSAAIITGDGNDTLNLTTTGIINGRIDMGAGVNTLNLSGVGSSTFNGQDSSATPGLTDWLGFTDVNVDSGSWTLIGGGYYDNATVDSGATLIVDDSGQLGANDGGIGVGPSGSLNLTVNGTLQTTSNNLVAYLYGEDPNVTVAGNGHLDLSSVVGIVLSGNNTFTGLTTVADGALVVVTGTMPGDFDIGANGSLIIGASFAPAGFDGGGEPVIAVSGAGATGDVSGNIAIDAAGLLKFNRTTAFTYGGQLSGAGKLIKDGTGMLSLSGNNLFTGGIDILEGGVRLLSNTAAGTGPITTFGSVISYGNGVNSAAPIIVNSNTTQLEVLVGSAEQSGAISETGGSRPIEKIGVGNLTLSGVNSYTGLTTITAGTLSAQGGSAIANTGAVTTAAAGTFALNTSETIGRFSGSGTLNLGSGTILTTGDVSSTLFSGSSSGAGGLTKSGSGTFTLTGANSFSGALNVANGNFTVTPGGSLANMSLSVANGAFAFLGGAVQGVNGGGMTGSALGGVTVSGGGTMYLDDNTNLSGSSLTLAGGSNLNLFLTTNTAVYPQITVSGAANVAGANLGVYLDPLTFGGTTATSFTYSNVITGASAAGTFGSVTLLQAPSALFTVAAIYSPTTIGLQINRNTFTSLGGGDGNDDNVGDGLDEIFESGPTDPDLVNLINTVAGSSPSSIEDIYAAIAGSENAESNGAAQRTDDPWKQSVAERVNAARTTGCTVAGDDWCLRRYAQANTGGEVMSDVQGDPTAFDWLETGIRDAGTTSVWGRVIGAWGQTYGDAFAPGSRQITGGLITGVDRVFDSLLLAGLAAQYVETAVSFDASRNSSNIQAGQLGAYVSYGGAEAYVNGNLSLIGSQAKSERFVSVGPLDYDITSVMRSWSYTASVEAGTILENGSFRFEPSFALNYQGALPDDYEERGGGGLSLLMRPEDSQSLRTIVSARLSRVFAMGDRKVVPQLRLDWRHEMLDRRQEFSAAFAGDPDVFFHVDGAAYARDTFAAGLSMTMPLTGKITGYVDAQGAFSDDSVSAMVSLGGRATW